MCKSYGREKPNGTEIMSMFPTELAAESKTERQNPQKAPKKV